MSNTPNPTIELSHFKIETSSRYIKIYPMLQHFKTQILIEKRTSKILLADKKIIYHEESKEVQRIFASLVIGIINFENQKVLVLAKSVYDHGEMTKGFRIYQIAQVQFISFNPLLSQAKQILQIMEKEIFSFSFYFSFERDLTLSFQQFYDEKVTKPKNRYFWNYEMLSPLLISQSTKESQQNFYKSEWCIPVVQGFYNSFDYTVKQNYKLEVFLIGRRSKHRSGTRFYNRGLDESGTCANFIQTQLALLCNNTLISTRYYSGSVPLFWQQISQLSKIKLTRDREFTSIPFKKHIKSMIKQNQHIMLINLLQKKKENQYILIKEYEHHVQSLSQQFQQSLKYAYFDINYFDKLGEYEKVWEFIEGFFDITNVFKSFQINLKTNVIFSVQKGAYRVSCLDCLARTNRFLQVLAFQSLFISLQKIHFFKESFKQLCLQILSNNQDQINPFLRYYKGLWEEKGQFQSIIYAGSSSTQSKKTKFVAKIQNTIISLQRYYNQKFIDQMKQRSLDIILYHKSYEPLLRLKHKLPFVVSIATWNVNATQPQKLNALELEKLFKMFEKSDLIVIGLQEMIELSTNNVMNDNTEQSLHSQKWKQTIQKYLTNKNILSGEYIFVQKLQMVGLFMIMFINKKWIHSLRSVHKDIVKTGIKIGVSEKYGNKGGIVIRVSILQTSLTFTCGHLAAHQNKVKERVNDLLQIHKKAFQQNKQSVQNELEIDFSDYKFFFGDLNFRLNGQFNEIKQLIEKCHQSWKDPNQTIQEKQRIWEQLMQKDQLYQLMNTEKYTQIFSENNQQFPIDYFKLYRESPIHFIPTYKLNKHTGQYTLEKNRNPSYCDRIMFWKNYQFEELNIDQELYTDVKIRGSDHRPVFGRFVVNILKETRKNSHSIILEESFIQDQMEQQQQKHAELPFEIDDH